MPDRPDFYVGYLAVPPRLRRFLVIAVPLLVVASVVTAAVVARMQRDPGLGTWTSEATSYVGVVGLAPYPMLFAEENGATRTYLLVREGKFGARDAVQAFDGREVTVRATRLERGGRAMLELVTSDDAVVPGPSSARVASPVIQALGRTTLEGEIIDPKCYLGAMKPGSGKAHRACATLCIRGGIPPMFVTIDDTGAETFYLLTDPHGDPIVEPLVPFIGEPVRVTGDLARRADLLVLAVDPTSIGRP
ncbi:MAG: hypothetical protein KDA25_12515 [Phycisphaerales bacterium]|nr:hypothetical protein [Phycisphaerales bacterium]